MTHTVHDPIEPTPLDSFSSPVEATVSVRSGQTRATAAVCANWSRIEVRLVSPSVIAGVTWHCDRGGFVSALSAARNPSRRYTYKGHLSARGLQTAQQVIRKVIQDHERVQHHAQEIARQLLRTHRQLQLLNADKRHRTNSAIRSTLKRAFKRGALTQCQYQQILHRLNDHRRTSEYELRQARNRLTVNIIDPLGLPPLSYHDALIHLSDPEILARLEEKTRNQMRAIVAGR